MRLFDCVIIIAALLLACSEDDHYKTCGVADPVNELPWLKAEIETVGSFGITYDYIIYQTVYQRRTVFISSICCPLCLTTPPAIKTCSGRLLGYVGVDADYDILDRAKVIWRTNNNVCP